MSGRTVWGRAIRACSLIVVVALGVTAAETGAATTRTGTPTGIGSITPADANGRARPVGTWSVERDGAGAIIRWTGPDPLPFGAARLEVRLGGELLGTARERGATAELRLRRAPIDLDGLDVRSLELWRGDSRLDVEFETPAGGGSTTPVERDRPHTRHLPFDPGAPGPYDTQRLDYELAPMAYREFEFPLEVVGEVTLPVGAPGARPLVLLLHGRHATCFEGGPQGSVSGDWPCPSGWQPVPSHRGYRAITELLASQGYVTVSIAANAINSQDFVAADGGAAARSALVRHHLAIWSWWSRAGGDPFGGVLRGRVDLGRVMLVGHSRGGEGVARAAVDSRRADPWRVLAIAPIGPTAFGRQVPATVDTMVLLPRCDGDVSDLQGQLFVDDGRELSRPADPALRSAVMLLGANHNFFNSEWTPGQAASPAEDDWAFTGLADDPVCGPASPRRLSPSAQQAAGASYVAIFARLVFQRDFQMLAQLDNSFGAPASARGAAVLVTALGGDRNLVYAPGRRGAVSAGAGMSLRRCDGWSFDGAPTCGFDFESRTPHWIPPIYGTTLPAATALELRWQGTKRFTLSDDEPIDLRGKDRIDLRIAVDPDADATWYKARLFDRSGHAAWVPVSGELRGLAGSGLPAKLWAQAARLNVRGVRGIDLGAIVRIDVHAMARADGHGTGHVFLLDAMVVDQYLPVFTPAWLPRAMIQDRTFTEDDTSERTIAVPIRITGFTRLAGRFWAETVGATGTVGRWISVAPGATTASVPLLVRGDNAHTGDQFFTVVLYPGTNVTTGRYFGTVRIVDDEAAPTLSAVSTSTTGPEGTELTWSLTLSEPQPFEVSVFAQFVAPAGGSELDSDDVPDEAWAQWVGADKPDPPETLSDAFAFQFVNFPAGTTTATVRVPVVADGVTEGDEHVAIELWFDGTLVTTLTGTVTD